MCIRGRSERLRAERGERVDELEKRFQIINSKLEK